MYDMIIVGGGPAGLSAAVYAARKRLKILLVSADFGGQINNTLGIENYLGYQFIEGFELIAKFRSQLSQYPIEQKIGAKVVRLEQVNSGFQATIERGETYQARAVVFAAGKKSKRLNVPGEAELAGKGVSYCAVCDGPVFAGHRVVVIGGGNSALEAALDLVKIAEHVDMVSLTRMTGDQVLVEKLQEAKNLSLYLEHRAEKIEGQISVTGLVVKNLRSQQTKRLDVSGVFIEIGRVPNSEPVKDLVRLNQSGEVPINLACETAVPGLYAAGDVTDVAEKQIIVAAGEGAKAALQAHRYLQRLAE